MENIGNQRTRKNMHTHRKSVGGTMENVENPMEYYETMEIIRNTHRKNISKENYENTQEIWKL
jgi:hypothetical protein